MNVDFRCEHCGKLLSAPAHANEPVRCPHCQKSTAVPAGLASLPRPKVQGEEAGAPLPPPLPVDAGGEEPHAAAPQGELVGTLETMMPFVISLFFHLGLILVTVFLTTTVFSRKEAPKEIVVPGTAISDKDEEAGGTLTPVERPSMEGGGGGSRFSKVTESSVQNSIIAAGGGSGDARPGMAMIGVGGAVGGTGTGTGTGKGTGWFSGGPPGGAFFGMTPGRGGSGVARHFVYVVDRSGSMLNTFDAVKQEMMTSIGQLDAEKRKQDFHVILFSEGKPLEAEDKRLVPATPEFQARATTWLTSQYAKGSTEVLPALTRAFDVLDKVDSPGGKVIFLLTDSDFKGDEEKAIALCKARNAKRDVHIFTFLYGDRPELAVKTMERIAQENGGKYKFVSGDE